MGAVPADDQVHSFPGREQGPANCPGSSGSLMSWMAGHDGVPKRTEVEGQTTRILASSKGAGPTDETLSTSGGSLGLPSQNRKRKIWITPIQNLESGWARFGADVSSTQFVPAETGCASRRRGYGTSRTFSYQKAPATQLDGLDRGRR